MAGVALKIAPLLAATAVFSTGSGLFVTLLPLRLVGYGYEGEAIGLVVSSYMVGFIVGCLMTQPLLRSVGHIRTYAAFAALAAVIALALDWSSSLPVWLALRFAGGFASAALGIVTESWLNALSTNETRGRVLTVYVLTTGLFYGLGQLAARDFEAGGSRLLMAAAALYALSLVPLTAIRVESPKAPERMKLHLLHAFKVSPTGALGCLATGLIAMTFAGIGSFYGRSLGLSQADIVFLLAASQIGGIALQFPLGWLSDRVDRRWVLVFMHAALIVVSAGFIVAEAASPFWFLIVIFIGFGGFGEALYPVSVAQAADRAKPEEYVPVCSNLLMLWALGGALGPLAGTFAIERGGADAFFWYVAGISLALGLFTLLRLGRRSRLADSTLEEFVVYPTTTPAVYEWVPHTPLKTAEKKDEPREDAS